MSGTGSRKMTLKKAKICLIGGGLQGGGQERSLVNMANYLVGKGFIITIINLFRTEQFYSLDEKINIEWPKINRAKYNRLIYAIKLLPYVRRKIKQHNPDVILSFGEWFNPFAVFVTRFMNVPVFLADRMGPTMRFDPLIQFLRKRLYRFADGIIVQTKVAKENVRKFSGVKNIRVIPNPLNPLNCKNSVKIKRIISVGRLTIEKGHIHLLRAFSMVKDKEWELTLVGDGIEKEYLMLEAIHLGINDRVVFHGQLPNFNSIICSSEIFVLPSLHEGFPNALLEAMSVPLACIASDCVAGPGEIIKDGVNGLLVTPGDEEELALAIDRLITDSVLRQNLATEAYKVRENYDFDTIAKEYLNFLFSYK